MIGIYTNTDRDVGLKSTKKLTELLTVAGLEFCCYDNLKGSIDAKSFFDEKTIPHMDMLITLGGDGTILSASVLFASKGIPICGINFGKVGFLAESEPADMAKCIENIVNRKYKIKERSMLSYSFDGVTGNALNELTLSRNKAERSLNFSINVRGETVSAFFGDGFLISTPTGSTAYSLSAGGPIVASDVGCMILTPLNPHSLFTRSIIVNDKEEITVTVDNSASVIADGRLVGVTDKTITVKKSSIATKLVVFNDKNFYSKLRKKLYSISILPGE